MKNAIKMLLLLCGAQFTYAQQKLTDALILERGKTLVVTASEVKEFTTLKVDQVNENMKNGDQKEKHEANEALFRNRNEYKYTATDGPQFANDANSVQTEMGTKVAAGLISQWKGLKGDSPLDPSGAAGTNMYVQATNPTSMSKLVSEYAVYNKSGNGATVFQGYIPVMVTQYDLACDPVIIYDKFADRWLLTQIVIEDMGANKFSMVMAVSKTNAADGAYTSYRFPFPGPGVPDYPKFGVWENGYYMTTNNGNGVVACFERAAMLSANPNARAIYSSFAQPANAAFGAVWLVLPGDADGLIPPSGLRCPLFAYSDNGWGSPNIDAVQVWSMGVNWGTNPTADISLDATLPTAAFDASFDTNWQDIEQPNGNKLCGLGGIPMYRAQWNNFVGTNRVVLNWAVKISNDQRSIKWVEIRQDQTTLKWSLYQEGIYAPDNHSRWTGSIAMDCNGDIALCYAKASKTVSPTLAYAGRTPNDPLGTLPIAETEVFKGSGSISGTERFGDYSHTALDPNGDVFWHTGMYCENSNAATGIYFFQIAPCATGIDGKNQQEALVTITAQAKQLYVKATGLPSYPRYEIEIFELSGKKIQSNRVEGASGTFETSIDLNKLSSGLYLVRVGAGDFQRVKKIMID